jgi:hypothetical protein
MRKVNKQIEKANQEKEQANQEKELCGFLARCFRPILAMHR